MRQGLAPLFPMGQYLVHLAEMETLIISLVIWRCKGDSKMGQPTKWPNQLMGQACLRHGNEDEELKIMAMVISRVSPHLREPRVMEFDC